MVVTGQSVAKKVCNRLGINPHMGMKRTLLIELKSTVTLVIERHVGKEDLDAILEECGQPIIVKKLV